MFNSGQCRVCGILGATGNVSCISGGPGWVAHGNHSRVPHRERLYSCESVTFGGSWTMNSEQAIPGFSAAASSSPASAAEPRTRHSGPGYRRGRSGWRCATCRMCRPSAAWAGISNRADRCRSAARKPSLPLTRRPICSNTCSGGTMLFLECFPHTRRPPATLSVGRSSVSDDRSAMTDEGPKRPLHSEKALEV